MTPLLLLGAGRMGGALLEGWRRSGSFDATDILIRDPHPSAEAAAAAARGARPPTKGGAHRRRDPEGDHAAFRP